VRLPRSEIKPGFYATLPLLPVAFSMLRSSIGRSPFPHGAMFFRAWLPRAGFLRVWGFRRAERTPARLDAATPIEPGRSFRIVYLRAAQAYMLISMPTGTSTILGVFQVICILRSNLA
jgi:hypothetical protein